MAKVVDMEKFERLLNLGDPYYTESAYGSAPNLQPGQWETNWPGVWQGPDAGFGPNFGQGPDMGFGPGVGPGQGFGPDMGFGPGMSPGPGFGPDMGFGPGMGPGSGFGPGMGFDPSNSWGSPRPGEMAELLRLGRDTNECCRQVLQMMRQMQGTSSVDIEE